MPARNNSPASQVLRVRVVDDGDGWLDSRVRLGAGEQDALIGVSAVRGVSAVFGGISFNMREPAGYRLLGLDADCRPLRIVDLILTETWFSVPPLLGSTLMSGLTVVDVEVLVQDARGT